MNNRIVIELSPEDRARLDALIAGLEKLQPNCDSCVDNVLHYGEALSKEKPTTPAPAPAEDPAKDETPFDTQPAAPATEPPSLADFQNAVTTCCVKKPAVKSKVRELVNRYAESVSEIPPEKRLEVLDLLAKL